MSNTATKLYHYVDQYAVSYRTNLYVTMYKFVQCVTNSVQICTECNKHVYKFVNAKGYEYKCVQDKNI